MAKISLLRMFYDQIFDEKIIVYYIFDYSESFLFKRIYIVT